MIERLKNEHQQFELRLKTIQEHIGKNDIKEAIEIIHIMSELIIRHAVEEVRQLIIITKSFITQFCFLLPNNEVGIGGRQRYIDYHGFFADMQIHSLSILTDLLAVVCLFLTCSLTIFHTASCRFTDSLFKTLLIVVATALV